MTTTRWLTLAMLLGGVALANDAHAVEPEEALASASQQVAAVNAGIAGIRQSAKSPNLRRTPAQQIADAVLLMGSKDYDRASSLLNQVVERFPDHPTAYPDGLRLLGEVYFRAGQHWSARRVFQKILASQSDPRFATYVPSALARLVDIAMQKRDSKLLAEVISAIDAAPTAASNLLAYARGKALLAKGDFARAKSSLAAVEASSEYGHQAQYLAALVAVKEATPAPVALAEGEEPPLVPQDRYAVAVDLFTKVAQLPADTAARRIVVDLAWMAVGRLFYETGQLDRAVKAYNNIDRESPEFGTMLYELSWVYVKNGDTDRALRALEVLAVADPKGQNIADGTLLRGDLLLRAGKFDKALSTYEGFKTTYEPMQQRVEAFLASTSDPGVYYDRLARKEFETLDAAALPPIALEWARSAEDGEAAFAIVDDVAECRELLTQSNEMVERLTAVINSPARVRAFPELKGGLEGALGSLNKTAFARLTLAQGLEELDDGALSGELASVRAERRSLEPRLKKLPTSDGDFSTREVEAERQWNRVSQGVQRLELQLNANQASINGIRRVIDEGGSLGVVRDPAAVAAWLGQLQQEERNGLLFRQQLETIRKMIRAGRVTAGFGDQRFIEDDQIRARYNQLVRRELELAASGAAGTDVAAYAQRGLPIARSADEADVQAAAVRKELEVEVEKRTQQVAADVARETTNLVGYQVRLDELDARARTLVGEVVLRNFGLVRDRIKNMVLRADVGITQHAWEVREDQITRVRTLQRERVREERTLTEELNEVLDDAGESTEEKPQ
jgi:tetratricopeptide (TPR) repeat protein